MGFEQRDNSGVLFKNDRKKPGDRQPELTGNAMINGENMRVSAWLKESSKGKFYSLNFQPQQEGGGDNRQASKPAAPEDDGMPF